MAQQTDPSIRNFRLQNGLAADEERKSIWMAQLGPFELPLPNWRWRRDIVAKHDSHHLLTGYDTSAKGELLVASWEIGACAYSDWRARTLCGLLTTLGLVRYPTETIVAYLRGKTHRR